MGEHRDHEGEADDAAATRWRRVAVTAAVVALAATAAFLALGDGDDDDDHGDDAATDQLTDTVPSGASPEPLRYVVELRADAGVRPNVTNDDVTPHTYTSDDGLFDSGPLEPRETATLPSLEAGTYPYHCEIHPDLTGELTIT